MDDSLGYDLRIKYGLTDDPTAELIQAWAQRVAVLADEMPNAEEAGRQASIDIFGELDGILYFSQADTIESLLARAKEK